MNENQKTLKTLSIVEIVMGIAYFAEGLIVTADKWPYFVSGAFTLLTGVICFLAVSDSSKAKPAAILLWITIVLDLIGMVFGIIQKAAVTNVAFTGVCVCIAAYMIKLIKQIHG